MDMYVCTYFIHRGELSSVSSISGSYVLSDYLINYSQVFVYVYACTYMYMYVSIQKYFILGPRVNLNPMPSSATLRSL